MYSGGQRIKKIVRTSGGDYEVTVYDGPFEYCKKVSGSTTYEKNYSQIEGGVEIRTGTAFPGDISDSIVYQLPDNIGSSNLRLSTTGTIIDKEEYYPFGDTSLRTFTYKRYRYVGKEKDNESGLYYYGARYYAAWTCRFISVDPLAAQYAHLNPYNYAGNKPINSIDIDGMQGSNEPTSVTDGGADKHATGTYNSESGEYKIASGDWLSAVAARFGTSTEQLAKINGIADPNKIKAESVIKISSDPKIEKQEAVQNIQIGYHAAYETLNEVGNATFTKLGKKENLEKARTLIWNKVTDSLFSHKDNVERFQIAWDILITLAYMDRHTEGYKEQFEKKWNAEKDAEARVGLIAEMYDSAGKKEKQWSMLSFMMFGVLGNALGLALKPSLPQPKTFAPQIVRPAEIIDFLVVNLVIHLLSMVQIKPITYLIGQKAQE
ncbi:MAG: RHS repeat-associated core domain-containing protein [Bacteroidota bacterium]